jgi:hypothetical protein
VARLYASDLIVRVADEARGRIVYARSRFRLFAPKAREESVTTPRKLRDGNVQEQSKRS